MWIILLFIVIGLSAAIFFFSRTKFGNFPWISFYLKGKESGFVFREINMLRKVAVENRLKDPTALFWSIKQLDYSIKGIILKYRSQGLEADPTANDFVSKLFDFRKRVEFQLPKYKLGLKNTREIPARQRLKITLPSMSPFVSLVGENLRKYLAIEYPKGPKLPEGFSWKGQQISVYFWRQGDAGYVFSTKVIDDYYDRKYPILHIAHTSNLVRSQKRKSVRVELSKNATLYPLKTADQANEEIETSQGLRCRLVDISEDGAAVLIGGRAKVGLAIKLQFELVDHTIVLNGIIKGVNYDMNKNRSLLHIQAFPPSHYMKNNILTYVYNVFGHRDDELPA